MRAQEFIIEGFLGEVDASAVQFRTASTDNYQSSFTVTAIADGKNVGHFSFYRDPETEDVHNQAEVTDDVRGKGYGKALLLKAIEVANDHGLGFQEDSQSLSRAQSRVYDSLYDAGWIVDADGYWLLTPEGEQELARLSTIQQGVTEGKLSVDVPNEAWLQEKIDYAKSKGRNSFGVPYMGSTTAGVVGTPPRVRVMRLASLPGMRNEQMNVRKADLKWLMDYMERTGKLPPMGNSPDHEYLPYIMVAYNGEAWVNEGNHRIMAAYRLNWQDMPIEIRYFDGGERIENGPMAPGKIGLA
jgi:GNAT superfamily N-acetyltransferase